MTEDILTADVALLLMYLTSWCERTYPDRKVRRAWKAYNWEVIDFLKEHELAFGGDKAKSLYLSEEGEQRARQLLQKFSLMYYEK